MTSTLLHASAMARLSMKLETAREDVLSPLARAGNVSMASLQQSGLNRSERRYVRRWVAGAMSGRSCMFALLSTKSDHQAESGFLAAGADHKLLFSLSAGNGKSSSTEREKEQGLGLTLLAASLNLPPAAQMLCNSGYLYESCFSLSPATVLRQAVRLVRSKTLQQNLDTLTTEQLNLALRQLQVQFLFDSTTEFGDSKGTAGSERMEKENQSPTSQELRLQERELHWQVLLEVVRIHVRQVNLAGAGNTDNGASQGTNGTDGNDEEDAEEETAEYNVEQNIQEELLRHLCTPLEEVQRTALNTTAADLEVTNKLLKPYLMRLAALKTRLSTQLADMEENEAYYTLGVNEKSSSADIKKAYHRLSRKCHPDKGGDKLEFQRLQAAYQEVLKRRKAKDDKKSKKGGNGEGENDDDNPKSSPDRNKMAEEMSNKKKKYNLGGDEDLDSDEMEEALKKEAATEKDSGVDIDGAAGKNAEKENKPKKGKANDTEKAKGKKNQEDTNEIKDEDHDEQDNKDEDDDISKKGSRDSDTKDGKEEDTEDGEDDILDLLSDSSDDDETRRVKSERLKALQNRARARRASSSLPPEASPDESTYASASPDTKSRDEYKRSSRLPSAGSQIPIIGPEATTEQSEAAARAILTELGGAMHIIRTSADHCMHLAQLSLYWQSLLDRAAGLEVATASEDDAKSDAEASDVKKLIQTLPPRDALGALIELVFDGCCANGRNDIGMGAAVDAEACALHHAVAPLESLCAGLQNVASIAMKLPSVGKFYGMATAKDDHFIASVEKCMQSGLDAMRCSIALSSVDGQLQTCLTRLQAAPEFRELRYGAKVPTASFGDVSNEQTASAVPLDKAVIKSRRLQKRLRTRLNAKFERRQLVIARKENDKLLAAERRRTERAVYKEERRKARTADKKVERLVLLQAAKRIAKRRERRTLRREARRVARRQLRQELAQLKQDRETREAVAADVARATARAARNVAERQARVAARAADLPEVPDVDFLEQVSARARQRGQRAAHASNSESSEGCNFPLPVSARATARTSYVTADSLPPSPPVVVTQPSKVSSAYLEGFDIKAVNRDMEDSDVDVEQDVEDDEKLIETFDIEGSDSDESMDDIMLRYQTYRTAYDENCRKASAPIEANVDCVDDVLHRYQAYRDAYGSSVRESTEDFKAVPSSIPTPSPAEVTWSYKPYDVHGDLVDDDSSLDSYGLPKHVEGESSESSSDDDIHSTFQNDVAEIDALLAMIEGQENALDENNEKQKRATYESPYNPRIHYSDSEDMDFMYSTCSTYRRPENVQAATHNTRAELGNDKNEDDMYGAFLRRGDDSDSDDSDCTGSSGSSTSSNASESDTSLGWVLDDISVSESDASVSGSSDSDNSLFGQEEEDDEEDGNDNDVFVDSNFNSIFDNLSESDGDTGEDSDDSGIGSDGNISSYKLGENLPAHRSGASILVDMVTTAYRSASASMNVAAEQVVSAACAASSVYRQAQCIVRHAETDLTSEAQAAARNMEAAEAEEDDVCEEDRNELKEMKRKQGEEESKANAQAAAEDAASEAIRHAKEAKEDEDEVEAELDAAGIKSGAQRETLRSSKLNSRKTDRELGELKDKIQMLQVKLRLQHVKNLQTSNGEARRLQNRLQAQFLSRCEMSSMSVTEPVATAMMAKENAVCVNVLQQELEKLRRSLDVLRGNEKSNVSPVFAGSVAPLPPVPSSPVQAMLSLLADFIDSSILDLRFEYANVMTGPDAIKCVMRHVGWLLALQPAMSAESVSPINKKEAASSITHLALPPDGRSKALWFTALLAPHTLKSLVAELQVKLDFLDAADSAALNTEAARVFGTTYTVFSSSFCARINSGVSAAHAALKT